MGKKVSLKYKKMALLSLKIGFGASVAIYVAQLLELDFATSSGIITLLTLVTTGWGTIKLSFLRLLTYVISVGLSCLIFSIAPTQWIAYGTFLVFLVFLCEFMGWRNTLSVNAVIGTHFLTTQDFSVHFLMNELLLVVIGITIAIVLNLFHINNAQKDGIIRRMRHVEHQMKLILEELSGYLVRQASGDTTWDDLKRLESELDEYLELAYEYESNTLHSHTRYYVDYFEMRMKQCGALHNLHAEMKRMREMPVQAHIVSDFIKEIALHVTEMNDPRTQMEHMEKVLETMREEPLPTTHEEFTARAELYHTILDLEEFIMYKKRFIESIDAKQFRIYWKHEIEGK